MEANLEEMKFVAEQEKVPKEEAAVKPVRRLKKQHRGWHLYAGFRGKQKEWTQGKGGCWKKLAAAHRRMTRRAGVTRCKGHGCKGQNKDDVGKRTQKGRTEEKRCWKDLEFKNGIRNQDLRQQLHLGSRRAFNKIIRMTFGLESMKQIAASSVRMQEVRDWTLWRGPTPSKMKKVTALRVGVGNVGEPATLGSFVPPFGGGGGGTKQDDGDTPGLTATLTG
jgi:hypothetical protein